MAENPKDKEEKCIDLDFQGAVEWLNKYMKRTSPPKTQKAVAIEMGVSNGMLSAFMSGKYEYPEKVLEHVRQLIKLRDRKDTSESKPAFKLTSISKTVLGVINYCHVQSQIGVAYGDAGIGKTMAALAYCRDNPDAIMITAVPCFATIAGMNELLAYSLKVKERTSRRMFSEIVNKLRDSGRVIIIDEAQHLSVRVINHLRSIVDMSKMDANGNELNKGVGIAFVGNEEIYLNMRGGGKSDYAQLFSRIGDHKHLVVSQIRRNDVELVFEEADLQKDALDLLYRISKTNYGLRGAVNVFMNTIIGFKLRNYGDVTADKIAAMAKDMNIA